MVIVQYSTTVKHIFRKSRPLSGIILCGTTTLPRDTGRRIIRLPGDVIMKYCFYIDKCYEAWCQNPPTYFFKRKYYSKNNPYETIIWSSCKIHVHKCRGEPVSKEEVDVYKIMDS